MSAFLKFSDSIDCERCLSDRTVWEEARSQHSLSTCFNQEIRIQQLAQGKRTDANVFGEEEELGTSCEKDLPVSFTEITTKPSLSSTRLN